MISVKAYLGSVFWRTMPIRMKIGSVVIHNEFVNANLMHDIALVKLENAVNFTDKIQPINLPASNESSNISTALFVPGFGDTKNASQSSLHLRFIKMMKISNEDCSKSWQWKIDAFKLCASGIDDINHTTCKGDDCFYYKNRIFILFSIIIYFCMIFPRRQWQRNCNKR